MTLGSRQMATLERLFQQEIEIAISDRWAPERIQPQVAKSLLAKGMIAPATFSAGRDAFGKIEVPGYALTHIGRATFCASCQDNEDGDSER